MTRALSLSAALTVAGSGAARAQDGDRVDRKGRADAAAERSSRTRPLPSLPEAPSRELPEPDAAGLDRLDEWLARLKSSDPLVRDNAVREILEAQPTLIAAIHHRMNAIADKADKQEMKDTLLAIRRKARARVRKQMRAEGKKGEVITPDYLEMVVDDARPESTAWQNLVSVLGMSRMLTRLGTVEAVRELIDVYVRFGEFLRVDTQLQLEELGDKAIAALVEARRHPARKISRWAERQLDMLGMAIPSEAVQTDDIEVLGDVLRAYGRIRDPDAARIVISFANSERAQVRGAARQAVAMLGDVATWQLKDAYENTVGKKPPRDWGWERTARELFAEFDRLRLSRVYDLLEKGQQALQAGELETMRRAFDQVLTRDPKFDRAHRMIPGYLKYARAQADAQPEAAIGALRRAERLSQDEGQRERIRSLLLTLQAEQLLEQRHVADQVLLRRARKLDSDNTRAQGVLQFAQRGEARQEAKLDRYLAAALIGGVALLAMTAVVVRGRRRRNDVTPAPTASTDAPDSAPANPDASPESEPLAQADADPGAASESEPPTGSTSDEDDTGTSSAEQRTAPTERSSDEPKA